VARARNEVRIERDPRMGIVQNYGALHPAFGICRVANVLMEDRRARVILVPFAACDAASDHPDVAVAKTRNVAKPVELGDRALRVQEYGADILGFGQLEEVRWLTSIAINVLGQPLDLALPLDHRMTHAENIFDGQGVIRVIAAGA